VVAADPEHRGGSTRGMISVEKMALGFVVNFFDTLGIGSFALTTTWVTFRRLIPDELVPGTL
jgi:hypothetical protein